MERLIDVAERRANHFLKVHGEHEWEKHDLLEEAREEIADAWNYIQSDMNIQPTDLILSRTILRELEVVWLDIGKLEGLKHGI